METAAINCKNSMVLITKGFRVYLPCNKDFKEMGRCEQSKFRDMGRFLGE